MAELLDRLQQALADRYRIERELGRGGVATVFLATDLKHQRGVALKVLHPELALALGSARFLREIATVAQFRHPNILPLHDSGVADGLLYYVMPFIEGETLRQRLEREKQLPMEDALRITREVGDALGYAHGLGVVHRDVKPENILFEAGHAVVTDFGIARAVSTAGTAKLTETGLAVGTPAYMSPEQAAGDPTLDGRSDIYSLACVLYEMLGGSPPFTGPTPQAVLASQIADPVPSLRTLRPAVPPGVERAVTRALAKPAAERYATAEEFVQQLTRASTAEAVASEARRDRARRRWRAALVVAVVIVVAGVGWWGVKAINTAGGHGPIRRLAVLPLTNLIGDTAQIYLVDGLQDLLITELMKLPSLAVISRASVMGYRNAPKPVPEVARELRVDAVVEGSVLRTGDSLILNVQLIDGRTESQRWAQTYPRTTRDALSLPPEAARAIAQHLGTAAGTEALARLPGTRAMDPRASDLYFRGVHACDQGTLEATTQGIQYLRRAIDLDATFARAYAELGMCYASMPINTWAAPQDAFPKALAAAEQALRLDSTLAEAYAVRASVKLQYDLDRKSPEADHARALQLSPSSADVHFARSTWLLAVGRFDEAVSEMRRATELDPLNVGLDCGLGWTYYLARRYDESIAQLRRTAEAVPEWYMPVAVLAFVYSLKGMHTEAVGACQRAMALRNPEDQGVPVQCAWVYGRAGRRAEARRLLDITFDIGRRHWLDPYLVAMAYDGLGETDQAFRWLDRAVTERSAEVILLPIDPILDDLRSDPRFAAVVRRARL